MSRPARAKQRDANELELIRAFRKMGFRVQQHDAWDLDVNCARCNALYAVEVKTADGTHTKAQKKLLEDGWPLYTLRSVQDVDRFVTKHIGRCAGFTRGILDAPFD